MPLYHIDIQVTCESPSEVSGEDLADFAIEYVQGLDTEVDSKKWDCVEVRVSLVTDAPDDIDIDLEDFGVVGNIFDGSDPGDEA